MVKLDNVQFALKSMKVAAILSVFKRQNVNLLADVLLEDLPQKISIILCSLLQLGHRVE
jgi:hypothetical protein